MAKYATIADFTNQEYEMTATGPGNQKLVFLMEVLPTARQIEIEFDLLPFPEAPPLGADPYRKMPDGSVHFVRDYDHPDYKKAIEIRRKKLSAWLIAESLKEPAIEGDSIEEKIAVFETFTPWIKSALIQGYNKLTMVSQEQIKVRPFRGDRDEDQPPAN